MGWFKKLTGISTKDALNLGVQAGAAYLTGGASLGVTGLGGFGGTLSDMAQSSYNTEMQKQLNQQAFDQNLEMWNLKNAYDSPAEQMKRFEEAGLNKNLIYGQSNVSGASPTFEAVKYNPVDRSAQRQELKLALMEHHQRVVNQSIENDLARQRIELASRAADRQDKLVNAQIQALGANLGLSTARIYDIQHKDRRTYHQKVIDDFYNLGEKMGESFANWYTRDTSDNGYDFLGVD